MFLCPFSDLSGNIWQYDAWSWGSCWGPAGQVHKTQGNINELPKGTPNQPTSAVGDMPLRLKSLLLRFLALYHKAS